MEPNTKAQVLPATCMELQKDILNEGKFLEATEATGLLKNYLEGLKTTEDPDGRAHNFGYLFGLNSVHSLMEKIINYNNSGHALAIEGIRVYPGRKDSLKIGDVVKMDTLFFMPVLADGTDLYKLYELTDDDSILGHPRPCPNECLMLSFL